MSRHSPILKLQMRAAQLDLARQKETVPFICSFVNFLAEHHFNALFLYLEDRVRTKSYPYPSVPESYSPEEMREVVVHARTKGIEVVPVVPNLGHTERFLRFPGMKPLAELREGVAGRFGSQMMMVCPSLDATYDFFRRYYGELAEIFPSPWLHVGNDESWDLGCCSMCASAARERGLSGLFAEHLLRTHRMVTGDLGKRTMMWDDMFEVCPQALDALPRDVALCCWVYDDAFEKPFAHFFNRRREDLFRRYDTMGFPYLLCPADGTVSNVLSFSRYATAHRPMGGLVTSWEKSHDFLLRAMPVTAFAGELWHDGDLAREREILRDTLRGVFGVSDAVFLDAMELTVRRRAWPGPVWTERVLPGFATQMDVEREQETRLLRRILAAAVPSLRGQAHDVLEDVLAGLRGEAIGHALRELLTSDDRPTGALNAVAREMEALAEFRAEQWRRLRPGIEPDHASRALRDLAERVRRLPAGPRRFVRLHGFLPDRYSAPALRVSVQFRDPASRAEIPCDCVKPSLDEQAYYEYRLPFDSSGTPERLRLEVSGYGGMGFRYVEVICDGAAFAPEDIVQISGLVQSADHVLVDDSRWAYLGDPDTARTFFSPRAASNGHVVEMTLQKV